MRWMHCCMIMIDWSQYVYTENNILNNKSTFLLIYSYVNKPYLCIFILFLLFHFNSSKDKIFSVSLPFEKYKCQHGLSYWAIWHRWKYQFEIQFPIKITNRLKHTKILPTGKTTKCQIMSAKRYTEHLNLCMCIW